MIELILLAIALSMDAFAVSIGLGFEQKKKIIFLGLMSGVYFGIFQALMPLIGYWGGKGVIKVVETYAPLVAFILLLFIGGKMIIESFSDGIENDIKKVTHRVMLVLAIATSIDAMAAGFALTLLKVSPLVACSIIGLTTFIFSYVGVFIGAKSGKWLESKAELFGGTVLVLIGIKILMS
ncbi:manganese efflux pump MntP [Aliikangiella sp. IMCC44359]|uniref:manganese efflux pump MntP n=1 Tax=Aliikangiella sp. IMCC44359 TaxID=3459125 RepID=UPI00403AC395